MAEQAPFTFTIAAHLAGVTVKALRGWLDRNQVRYPSLSTRCENAWRRFSLSDILHLAIVGTIIKYDFRIEFADNVARQITDGLKYNSEIGLAANLKAWERLKDISLKLRHPHFYDEYDSATDELVSEEEQHRYGAYLEIRPSRILEEIKARLSDPGYHQFVLAMTVKTKELDKQGAENKQSRVIRPKTRRKPAPAASKKAGHNA